MKGSAVLPRLLPDHEVEQQQPAKPLTAQEAGQLRTMMRAVVERGSGSILSDLPGGPVIAKTGTAEFGDKPPLPTHAWMVAGRGDLAVAVFVERGESGSRTAGPVLEQFLRTRAPMTEDGAPHLPGRRPGRAGRCVSGVRPGCWSSTTPAGCCSSPTPTRGSPAALVDHPGWRHRAGGVRPRGRRPRGRRGDRPRPRPRRAARPARASPRAARLHRRGGRAGRGVLRA